jgi:hypothetical protein
MVERGRRGGGSEKKMVLDNLPIKSISMLARTSILEVVFRLCFWQLHDPLRLCREYILLTNMERLIV